MPYLNPQVADDELLTNFVLESNKFRKEAIAGGGSRDVIYYKAFLPKLSSSEQSVFRMDGVSDDTVRELGRVFVAQPRDKSLLGWARIAAGVVRCIAALVVRADEPPPRHALIENWPPDIEQRRAIAIELASEAAATRL
jgi:hypothetical protein